MTTDPPYRRRLVATHALDTVDAMLEQLGEDPAEPTDLVSAVFRMIRERFGPAELGAMDAVNLAADAVRIVHAAGRLLPEPLETQWGVQWHGMDVIPQPQALARETAAKYPNAVAVRRHGRPLGGRRPRHQGVIMAGLLTEAEHRAVEMAAELWNHINREVIGTGRSRAGDLSELAGHIHGIQQMVLAQAAGRAYPHLYRLLGETLPDLSAVGGAEGHPEKITEEDDGA